MDQGSDDCGLTFLTSDEVVIESGQAEILVGVVGEMVMVSTPVRCTVRARALRVRVPRNRPRHARLATTRDWPAPRLASFRPDPTAVRVPARTPARAAPPFLGRSVTAP